MRKLAVCLLLVLAGTAAADDKKAPPPAPAGGGDAKGNGKVKVYDFSADSIEGDLVKPEGIGVNVADFSKHSSLIKIRQNFIPEIVKSAEDL
jgi:hypothetical protein